jgi:hypothetical protein
MIPVVPRSFVKAAVIVVAVGCFFFNTSSHGEDQTLDLIAIANTRTPWGGEKNLDVPQFNAANGTLKTVTLEFTARARCTAALANKGILSENGSVKIESTLEVTIPDHQPVQARVTGTTLFELEADPDGGVATSTEAAIGSKSLTVVLTEGLSTFVGVATVKLAVTEQTTSTLVAGRNVSYIPKNFAGVSLTVTYNYSPQPTNHPEIVEWALAKDGQSLALTVAAKAGSTCQMVFSSSTAGPELDWKPLPGGSEQVVPASGRVVFTVKNVLGASQAYFRALVP